MLKVIGWVLLTLIGIVVVIDVYWDMTYYKDTYSGLKFDKEVWQGRGKLVLGEGSSVYGTNPACRMYDDLVKNHLKKGMSVSEVEELLGKSGLVYYYPKNNVKCSIYSLGTCYASSWTLSHGHLVVCYNKQLELVGFGKDRNHFIEKFGPMSMVCLTHNNEVDCDCYYTKDQTAGEICPFEIERW